MHQSVEEGDVIMDEVAIGILSKNFSFTYLVCPNFYKRKHKTYYQRIIQKIGVKLQTWKEKLLSYRGRVLLIKYVLQITPIHYPLVMNPPLNVLNHIHKIISQFIWSCCIRRR